MRLDDSSLAIIKEASPPKAYRISLSGDTITIEGEFDANGVCDVLFYSSNVEDAFDFAIDYMDHVDGLYFVDDTLTVRTVAQKQGVPSVDELLTTILKQNRNFEHRKSQFEMANGIYKCLTDNKMGIFEAPTGTGKSLAYLVPAAVYAKRYGAKVVISTNTINLQRQLVEKDLPLVASFIDVDYRIALGRSNYMCKRKLDNLMERGDVLLFESEAHNELKEFKEHSTTGLKSDFFSKKRAISEEAWELVASNSLSCAHSRCPYYKSGCFYYKARAKLENTDLIVANHHLVLSDAITQHGRVLPQFDAIVFDEAHNLEKNATNYFTKTVSTVELKRILKMLHSTTKKGSSGLLAAAEKNKITAKAIAKVNELSDFLSSASLKEGEFIYPFETDEDLEGFASSLLKRLNDLHRSLEPFKEDTDIAATRERLKEITADLEEFLQAEPTDNVAWIKSTAGYVHFNITPLGVDTALKESLYERVSSAIFTSATISVNGDFTFFKRSVGIEKAIEYVAENAFDYASATKIVITEDAPPLTSNSYEDALEFYLMELAQVAASRSLGMLVLFTSYNMLNEIHRRIANRIKKLSLQCLKQGDMDNFETLQVFKSKPSVLLATSSFWEGIDVKGKNLSILVITRLPFEVPTTPVERSRYQHMKESGINAFMEYALPKAVLKFRQGFGRLIRDKTDRGVVVVTDSRIVKKSYGVLFLNSLPEAKREVVGGEKLKMAVDSFFSDD